MNLAAVRHGVALQPRTILGLVEIALVLLLAVQAARLVWIVVAPPSGPLGVAPTSGAGASAQTEILARFDPFFRLGGPSDAPVTTGSDLQLYGVRTGGASASAILGPPGGAQTLYFIGEQGPDGITLVEVADDHVVVRQGANRRRIGFPTPGGSAYAPPPTAATTAQASEAAPGYSGAQLMAALALAPRMREGRSAGYTVTPRGAQGAAILAQAGLQPGDVLLTIDGSELNGERMSELPQILATATHVDVSYERGGQVMNTRLRMSAP
ncbi:MAG: type II secretion system protein N [Phenylobacterium sp.]|uniref:type II secretion system protein N n=1 Tax=Phenylobacterium sp. TaxID=1871053 RepID=UPI00271D87B3|nr:type II secretion system protein N [Phenylobacterium sp.]MDO8409595.1 type II secretion system protein N [Phenylobacterium sp.]